MASTIITKNKNTGTPSSLVAGELAINTTEGSLYYGSTGGTSVSSSFKFGMVTASVVSASGNVEGGSLRADDLTAGRVAFVGTDGLLVDDSDLTFTTATLTATNLASTTVNTTNLGVTNIKAKDGTAAGSIADSSGRITLANTVLTTTDINGGTIDGCDITVGTGKTLELRNASAVNLGDINAANISVTDDIIHTGDLNNLISFDTDTQDFQTGGSSRLDISDSGVRLGGTGARVTSITDSDSLGTSDTVLCTQGNVKAYTDATHATVQTGKNYRIINCSFRDDIGTTKHYLPLKSQDEQIALTREEGTELAVCDGRLVSATVRVENMGSSNGDFNLTMGVETNVIGASYGTFDGTSETETLVVNDGEDNHNAFHFTFSTAKHWDATDMFAISIESSADAWGTNERFFITLVIEDDWSTYLGTSNAQYSSTP